MRKFGADILLSAIREAVWAERAGTLVSLGLKVVDEGAFDVPAPEHLASHMNQVVVQYGQLLEGRRDKARRTYHGRHEFELYFVRQLGDTERPETAVRQGGELLAEVFLQGDFKIPGFGRSAGVEVEECYPTGLVVQEGFPLGEDVHAEVCMVRLYVAAMCYDPAALLT